MYAGSDLYSILYSCASCTYILCICTLTVKAVMGSSISTGISKAYIGTIHKHLYGGGGPGANEKKITKKSWPPLD